jgi:integrase
VITPRILAYLLEQLDRLQKPELKTAAWLAARAGLRVSEVCRLRARDLVLEGLPYLLAVRSKRNRSRRVSLEHFRSEELEMLRQLQQSLLLEGENPHLLSDKEGQPLESKKVSAEVGAVLAPFNPAEQAKAERRLSSHSLRAFAAEFFFWLSWDIRYAALQLGHALAATTAGSYLHTLDLRAVPLLQARISPLTRPDLHVPVAVVAVLLERTPQRILQMIQAFNAESSQPPLELRPPEALPDGQRPRRPGRPALYLSVTEALSLVRWLLAAQ